MDEPAAADGATWPAGGALSALPLADSPPGACVSPRFTASKSSATPLTMLRISASSTVMSRSSAGNANVARQNSQKAARMLWQRVAVC